MLGLSISKIIFTILIIGAVWYGFRWMNRMGQSGAQKAKERLRRASGQSPAPVEDMKPCVVCGDFVIHDLASNCGRENCPFPKS